MAILGNNPPVQPVAAIFQRLGGRDRQRGAIAVRMPSGQMSAGAVGNAGSLNCKQNSLDVWLVMVPSAGTVSISEAWAKAAPLAASKWCRRFKAEGSDGLQDRSSRPARLHKPTSAAGSLHGAGRV